jgi:hypothetical protein
LFGSHSVARRATILAAFAALLIAVSGCGSDDSAETTGNSESSVNATTEGSPPPIQLLSGSKTGVRVDEPTVYLIRDKKALTELNKKHASAKGVTAGNLSTDEFKTRETVAVFLPPSAPGTTVIVDDVQEEDGVLVVNATKQTPGKGCPEKGGKTHPFTVVDTAKGEATKAKLVVSSQANSPC